MPAAPAHLLVEAKGVDLGEHPAHAAIPPAHQDPEGGELLEEAQSGGDRREGLGAVPGTHQDPAGATPGHPGRRLPQVRAPVHEVEDLGRVEELLELAQKLDALVVPALGVDEGQERAGAGRGAGGLPETCGEPKHVSPQPRLPPTKDTDGDILGEQRPRGHPDHRARSAGCWGQAGGTVIRVPR